MSAASSTNFTRLADGTLLQRQDDGSYRPVPSATDRGALAELTDAEIERMAARDPDHPPLDDAFWAHFDAEKPAKKAISIKLDGDILAFFRQQGRGYQTRINAVLRHYVEAHKTG